MIVPSGNSPFSSLLRMKLILFYDCYCWRHIIFQNDTVTCDYWCMFDKFGRTCSRYIWNHISWVECWCILVFVSNHFCLLHCIVWRDARIEWYGELNEDFNGIKKYHKNDEFEETKCLMLFVVHYYSASECTMWKISCFVNRFFSFKFLARIRQNDFHDLIGTLIFLHNHGMRVITDETKSILAV